MEYSCETWTVTTVKRNKLDAFEMQCFCKFIKIKWTEKVTNEAVLTGKKKKKRKLWRNIKIKREKMIEYLLGLDSLMKSVIEGDIEGYIEKDRPRTEYMK